MGRIISAFIAIVAFAKGTGTFKSFLEALADLLREASGQLPDGAQPQAMTEAVDCGDPVAFMETAIENHKAGRQPAMSLAALFSLVVQLLGLWKSGAFGGSGHSYGQGGAGPG